MMKKAAAELKRRAKLVGGANPLRQAHYGHARDLVVSSFPKDGRGVEIGVFKGAFSKLILDEVRPKKLFLVDPWMNFEDPTLDKSWYGRTKSNDMEVIYDQVCSRFSSEVKRGQVDILRGKTEEVEHEILDDGLDFAYVDGDHRYDGVAYDLDFAFKKVKVGGFIAADDYVLGNWWGDGVVRAVNEFLGQHAPNLEIISMHRGQVTMRKH